DAYVQDTKEGLVLDQFTTSFIEDLTMQGINLQADKQYYEFREKLKVQETTEYQVPCNLQAELRDYQAEGFRWMARLDGWGAGACLADDMGLGKTIQTISMLLYKAKEGPSLVVAPASVLPNWIREISNFAPSLNIVNLSPSADRLEKIRLAQANDVCIVTYGVLVTEEERLTQKEWSMIALDEAHTIKNKETKMSKAAMKLKADFRLILTGTPIQNHLGEIWNLFNFINPGLLGTFERFKDRFVFPIIEMRDKEQQKRLKKLISPFLLRRTKNAVLDELPPKTEIVKEIQLSEEETAAYELIRREAETKLTEDGALTQIQALAEITRLRMAACNINLVNKGINMSSSKINTFLDIVDELKENNHRALVFSQFTSHLALIRKALDEKGISYLYLDGSTSIPEREKLVRQYQTGDELLFLISLKAGGLGLNLTAADFVIHMDPWWNPAIEDQASDRAYR
ncbi:MAG: DEAD/DEAH box helicase, partial [Bacteroidales bacterium]